MFEQIAASDGVAFASPTYVFGVSGWMKVFLDRFGFVCHRPRFFGKTFSSIGTQGFFGASSARNHLDLVGQALGFNGVKGICLTALDPPTEREERRMRKAIARLTRRFHDRLAQPAYPVPSLFKLLMFRIGRTQIRRALTDASRDFTYYRDKGWFDADYYYPVRLGPMKKIAGHLFDVAGAKLAANR